MELPPSLRFYASTLLKFIGIDCVYLQVAEARRALPCWDEPAHKATYDIALVVPKDRIALSNMVGVPYHCMKLIFSYFRM